MSSKQLREEIQTALQNLATGELRATATALLGKLGYASHKTLELPTCRIPDDCIDSKRYPLFMARDVMRVLIEQLQAEGATPS